MLLLSEPTFCCLQLNMAGCGGDDEAWFPAAHAGRSVLMPVRAYGHERMCCQRSPCTDAALQ